MHSLSEDTSFSGQGPPPASAAPLCTPAEEPLATDQTTPFVRSVLQPACPSSELTVPRCLQSWFSLPNVPSHCHAGKGRKGWKATVETATSASTLAPEFIGALGG